VKHQVAVLLGQPVVYTSQPPTAKKVARKDKVALVI
jgi:hypothetical protein